MKLFLRIINNDTRRNWTLLAAWIGTLIFNASLHAGSQAWLFEMTDVLVWLTPAILIFSWMNEECFVGIGEFWMTRPLSPLRLISAKLCGLLLWLSIPYLAYNFVLTQIHDTSLSLALSILGESFAYQHLPIWLLLIMLAMLTRSFAQALILSVCCFICVAVLANVTTHFWGRLSWIPHYKYLQLSLPQITIAAMGASLMAIFTQARFRHRGLTAALILLSAAAVVQAPKLRVLTRAVISPLSLFQSNRALSVTMDNKVRLFPQQKDTSESSLGMVSVQIAGLAANETAAVMECRYSFQTEDGTQHWKMESSPRFRLTADLESENIQKPLLLNLKWLDRKPTDLTNLQKGRLTAKLLLAIHSLQRVEAPWKVGSTILADGLRVKMNSLLEKQRLGGIDHACKIVVTGYDRWKSNWLVLLQKNQSSEQCSGYGNLSLASSFTTLNSTELNTPLRVYRKSENKADKPSYETVTPSWLEGASLVLIQSHLVHTQTVTVVVDDFEMPVPAGR